ncbi:peptide-methionine (S)-S-oxide reductase MsrA [Eubacteriaceae bacterium ES3]|nr:peptide-methionine (S)-S-oxide reductase MsrA [Eubacteriaceae bacterium ES3]
MKKEIILAGGCFWGLEKYFQEIGGVEKTQVGFANGKTSNPSYEDVCYRNTGHAEVVYIVYDSESVSLPFLLEMYYQVIDPTVLNRQGPDTGTQYRTGIYYTDSADIEVIQESLNNLQKKFKNPVVIELLPLENYAPADDSHQRYLDKHPGGYCHIDKKYFEMARKAKDIGGEKT